MVKCTAHTAVFAVRIDRNPQYSKRGRVCKKFLTTAVVFNFTQGQESKFRFPSTILPHLKNMNWQQQPRKCFDYTGYNSSNLEEGCQKGFSGWFTKSSHRLLPCFNLFDFSWLQVTLVCTAENAPELTLWNTWVNFDLSGAAIHEIICPTVTSSNEMFLTKYLK